MDHDMKSDKNMEAKKYFEMIDKVQDVSVFIPEEGGAVSHRKIIRRWNQLSRFQRSLAYGAFVIAFIIILLLYPSQIDSDAEIIKTKESKLVQRLMKNMSSLVMKQTVKNIEPTYFTGPMNARQYAVVESFKHAWSGYKKFAWGHDNLKPLSGSSYDWFGLGLTIIDSLDTALIMGLNEEYEEGRDWVEKSLHFDRKRDVNFFEVTIRVLGALLSNYHFTEDEMFLKKAEDLGDRLMGAFTSRSNIPFSDVNLGTRTAHAPEWSPYSSTSEVATVQLEFRELTRVTNNPVFEEAAALVSEKIHQLPKKHGLVPIFISPHTGQFLPHSTITLGARGDSYYEYLLKQWIQSGKTINYLLDDYMSAIEGVREFLAKRSSPNKYLFIGELSTGSEAFNPKMDHLTCFLPGTLALGHYNGLPDWHMTMAEELLYTCYLTYANQPTFLAPEITHFNMGSMTSDMYTKSADAHNLLRPEFIESLWYMYQITGNTTYQDWGWQIYQAFEEFARVPNGYTSLTDVRSKTPASPYKDMMESFFLSETLKYFYLLFSDDRYHLDLKKFVITTEAHPLPIRPN